MPLDSQGFVKALYDSFQGQTVRSQPFWEICLARCSVTGHQPEMLGELR